MGRLFKRRGRSAGACTALLVAGGLLAASGANADPRLDLYRPVLRYDAAEEYFAQPVSRRGEVIDRYLVYGHVAREDGETWLQYWFFYAYNQQDRGVLGTGRHEGDWEFVQLRLPEDGRTDRMTFAQHSTAESCAADELVTERIGSTDVPVVFVANGSHASYPREGTADRPWPDPNDEAGGDIEVRPALEPITSDEPEWVADPRPWGGTRSGWFPGEQSSPPGPRFQDDERWGRPSSYDAAARRCGTGPPDRPWQTPAIVVLAVGLVAGAFRLRR